MSVRIVAGDEAAHGEAVLAIFNDAILHSTALYEYRPRTREVMARWFAARRETGAPVLVAEDDDGTVAGFASWGPFRSFPAYKYTVEHSVYVQRDRRGRGVGRALLRALLERAELEGLHVMVGAVDAANAASVALHERMGFVHAGRLHAVGFKFGRWLDLDFYQRVLAGPAEPVDG
jgi:phosphinothricin acetyltransferase